MGTKISTIYSSKAMMQDFLQRNKITFNNNNNNNKTQKQQQNNNHTSVNVYGAGCNKCRSCKLQWINLWTVSGSIIFFNNQFLSIAENINTNNVHINGRVDEHISNYESIEDNYDNNNSINNSSKPKYYLWHTVGLGTVLQAGRLQVPFLMVLTQPLT